MTDKSWLESLSEILNKPLPGTESKHQPPAEKPVVFTDEDDDASLLDRITDILSKPLPGTEQADAPSTSTTAAAEPENPGETAVREASDADDDDEPVSTTAAAGADWMQREYERFNQHQEAGRQAFSEQQRIEQERFAAYQQAQLDQFMRSQGRERTVFRQHQEARFQAWRHDLRHAYRPAPGQQPNAWPHGMRPPPPPPPWWRK